MNNFVLLLKDNKDNNHHYVGLLKEHFSNHAFNWVTYRDYFPKLSYVAS